MFNIETIRHILKIIICTLLTLPRDFLGLLIFFKIKKKTYFNDKNEVCVSDIFKKWVYNLFII
jgi:hypothetical protein